MFSRDAVEDAIAETGRREQRRRLLPAHVMIRFCMAMTLFPDDDYEEVMRKLVGSLRSMGSWSDNWQVPTTSAISQARRRLGREPLERLFEVTAVPVAKRGVKGAWLGSRRLMAIDGFNLDLDDTEENREYFGKRTSGAKSSAFPQALVVGLGECGSHAIIDASLAGCRTAESNLAADLLRSFDTDMLVIADRHYYGFTLWRQAVETGADLLWRASATVTLPVLKPLPDGSYRSVLINPRIRSRRRDQILSAARNGVEIDPKEAVQVRVVEYEVPDRHGNGTGELICLITSILDPQDTTAVELAAAYHERWEFEGLIDEVKTHQRGAGRILRSKSPEMVKQEIWAYLLTHYGVRSLMCQAADEADVDPNRLSSIRSLRVIRRQVTDQAGFSPSTP